MAGHGAVSSRHGDHDPFPGDHHVSSSPHERTTPSARLAALKGLLAGQGWVSHVAPLERSHSTSLNFVQGRQGLSVGFTIQPGTNENTTELTTVSCTARRLQFALPIPQKATDLVFYDTRPYLGQLAEGTPEALHDFYSRSLDGDHQDAVPPRTRRKRAA